MVYCTHLGCIGFALRDGLCSEHAEPLYGRCDQCGADRWPEGICSVWPLTHVAYREKPIVDRDDRTVADFGRGMGDLGRAASLEQALEDGGWNALRRDVEAFQDDLLPSRRPDPTRRMYGGLWPTWDLAWGDPPLPRRVRWWRAFVGACQVRSESRRG